jgi:hypothetical protein
MEMLLVIVRGSIHSLVDPSSNIPLIQCLSLGNQSAIAYLHSQLQVCIHQVHSTVSSVVKDPLQKHGRQVLWLNCCSFLKILESLYIIPIFLLI